MPVKVVGSKHVSYWLPIPKNAYCSMSTLVKDCHETRQVDHASNRFRWVIIRNPFSRLYSCWADKVNTVQPYGSRLPTLRDIFKAGESSFESFVDWILETEDEKSDGHWRSQDRMLRDQNFKPNFILRFEALGSDWKNLADVVGLCPKLEKHNCTRKDISDHTAHMNAYSRSLRRKVADRYHKDFKRFGYHPDKLVV